MNFFKNLSFEDKIELAFMDVLLIIALYLLFM